VALGVLDALTELHAQSIFHRDLKTENVLMDGEIPKVTDLGIAEHALDDAATMHTQMKDFIGSIRFACPQFVRGEPFRPEDDLYAFGTVLFELLTGAQVYDDVERRRC
jgi:serine/threonine protein kinase